MSEATRDIRQSTRMTETEALMWAAESDPWLSSGMGSVFVLDEAPDFERFLASMEVASHSLLRLREKVDDSGGIAPPRWVIDDDFDINEHVRRVKLPGKGGVQELLDLTAQVFQDPFDVHRPLWQFVAVEGPSRKTKDSIRGGIIIKLHHSVSDGIGALRLAEMYLDFERNPKPAEASDLPPVPETEEQPSGAVEVLLSEIDYVVRQQLDVARRVAAEVSLWSADRARIKDAVSSAGGLLKSVSGSFTGGYGENTGSPLWKNRSRHRHLEAFDMPLDDLRAASKRLGGSINDVFVAGSAIAASRYHEERNTPVEAFNLSFIISTRSDNAAGGNSFAPIPFSVTGTPLSAVEMFEEVKTTMAAKREEAGATSADAMELAAGLATMLPDSMIAKAGRARAAKHDWATSNLRGAPIPIFVAGGQITHMYPVGPLGGTAFNLTAMSYNGNLHFGVFIDPRAVDDPKALRRHLVEAYATLCS